MFQEVVWKWSVLQLGLTNASPDNIITYFEVCSVSVYIEKNNAVPCSRNTLYNHKDD